MDWTANLITNGAGIQDLLRRTRRVAVLGARPERYPHKPAYYVPAALARMGLEIVPVPVYDRDVATILGQTVYRTVAEIPGEIDMVNVFRRPEHIPAHLDDILAKRPRAVWFQTGIRNDQAAEILARAGIQVVQNRCLMIEYQYVA